jgi:hypothetical protein
MQLQRMVEESATSLVEDNKSKTVLERGSALRLLGWSDSENS